MFKTLSKIRLSTISFIIAMCDLFIYLKSNRSIYRSRTKRNRHDRAFLENLRCNGTTRGHGGPAWWSLTYQEKNNRYNTSYVEESSVSGGGVACNEKREGRLIDCYKWGTFGFNGRTRRHGR